MVIKQDTVIIAHQPRMQPSGDKSPLIDFQKRDLSVFMEDFVLHQLGKIPDEHTKIQGLHVKSAVFCVYFTGGYVSSCVWVFAMEFNVPLYGP